MTPGGPCHAGLAAACSVTWAGPFQLQTRDVRIHPALTSLPDSRGQKVLSGPRAELNLPGLLAPSPRGQPASPQRSYRAIRTRGHIMETQKIPAATWDLASCRAGRVTQATPQAAWLPAGLAPARFGADPLCPGRRRKACSAEGGHHLNLGALQGRTSQKAKPSGHTVTVFCPLKQSLPWREKVAQTVPWKRKWRALSRPRGSECRTEVRLEPHPVCPAGPSHHTLSFLPPPPRAGRCE